jgi:hypothetical protein
VSVVVVSARNTQSAANTYTFGCHDIVLFNPSHALKIFDAHLAFWVHESLRDELLADFGPLVAELCLNQSAVLMLWAGRLTYLSRPA